MRPRRHAARQHSAVALCLAAATALCFTVANAAPATAAPRWSYYGADGPDRWAAISNAFATCGNGREQSPVDLARATERDLVNPEAAYRPGDARIVDDGHTVEVDVDGGSILTLDGVPYGLVQFHFHSPSEHTVNGNSFAVELHLVHRAESGAFAVVGVFIAGGAQNPALVPVLAALPSKEGKEVRLREPFDPSTLLPEDRRAYRYTGSLTTPPCTEGVSWVVMATPIQASGQQIAALARALEGNNRPPQAIGDRAVVLDSTP